MSLLQISVCHVWWSWAVVAVGVVYLTTLMVLVLNYSTIITSDFTDQPSSQRSPDGSIVRWRRDSASEEETTKAINQRKNNQSFSHQVISRSHIDTTLQTPDEGKSKLLPHQVFNHLRIQTMTTTVPHKSGNLESKNCKTEAIENEGEERKLEEDINLEVSVGKWHLTITVDGITVVSERMTVGNVRFMKKGGLYLTVLNPTAQVTTPMLTARYRSFEVSGDRELVRALMGVQPGRLMVLAAMHEGFLQLSDLTLTWLSNLGSLAIDDMTTGDRWAWVWTQGGRVWAEGAAWMGDKIRNTNDTTKNTFMEDHIRFIQQGGPLRLHSVLPRASLQASECGDWPRDGVWEKRRKFCNQYEGYGDLCSCSDPLPLPSQLHQDLPPSHPQLNSIKHSLSQVQPSSLSQPSLLSKSQAQSLPQSLQRNPQLQPLPQSQSSLLLQPLLSQQSWSSRKQSLAMYPSASSFSLPSQSPNPQASPETKAPGSVMIPTVVVASQRPLCLYWCLRRLMNVGGSDPHLTLVVADGDPEGRLREVRDLVNLFGIKYVDHDSGGKNVTLRITRHYKFVLDTAFATFPTAPTIIVLEEDLFVASDFYGYFGQLAPLLLRDPTLYCVSAWNDLGRREAGGDPAEMMRSQTMAGLGWMLTREIYQEIMLQWPDRDKAESLYISPLNTVKPVRSCSSLGSETCEASIMARSSSISEAAGCFAQVLHRLTLQTQTLTLRTPPIEQ